VPVSQDEALRVSGLTDVVPIAPAFGFACVNDIHIPANLTVVDHVAQSTNPAFFGQVLAVNQPIA